MDSGARCDCPTRNNVWAGGISFRGLQLKKLEISTDDWSAYTPTRRAS